MPGENMNKTTILTTSLMAAVMVLASSMPVTGTTIGPNSPTNTCSTAGQGDDSGSCTWVCKPGTIRIAGQTTDKDAKFNPGSGTCGAYVAKCVSVKTCSASASNPNYSGTGTCYAKVQDPWLNHGWTLTCETNPDDANDVLQQTSAHMWMDAEGVLGGLVCNGLICVPVVPQVISLADGIEYRIG